MVFWSASEAKNPAVLYAVPGSAASMWVSEMPEDTVGWLEALGWAAETFTLRERAEAYGRPVLTPAQYDEGAGGLVSAVRAAH